MLPLNEPLADLVADAAVGFQRNFGVEPSVTAAAPGRVNLIGEHIDYCDGFVLPFAIDRYIVIAATLNGTNEARIASAGRAEQAVFRVDEPMAEGEPEWANYLRGVIAGFQQRGHHIPGFDAYIASSVPGGAGLSSSAAAPTWTAH